MRSPRAAYHRFVRLHSEPMVVYRRDDASNSQYGNKPTYSELSEKRQILLTENEESELHMDAGEYPSKRLVAYTIPETDLIVNDRLDFDGGRIEVISKEPHPTTGKTAIYKYGLDDV